MKRILSLSTLLAAGSTLLAAFTPPSPSVSTVSVNSSNQLVAPNATTFFSTNAATLTNGSGISGSAYNASTAQTWAIDTTWLTDNYHKTLTRGTGLTGDNYNGTAISTFAVDTTWLTTNYHKNLTVQNGVELTDGTTYNGQTAKSIQVDKVYMLAWANGLKRDFYVYVDMEIMFRIYDAYLLSAGDVHLWYDTTATVIDTNVFYYKKEDNTVVRTVNSSGNGMPNYNAKIARSRAIKPTDIELKVLDKYGNIVYYTATIMLNSSLIKSLHPEITDNSPTIYYFNNEDNFSNADCYGTKTKFTNFNSYIGSSAKNISGIWVYPSISDATLCNGVARPRIPIYTEKATVSGYYPDTTKWGDYIRSVMENPENTIIVWRKTSTYSEEIPNGTNYWRPVQITHYGDFHD